MPTVVDVPGHGEVEFPDGMSDADITSALRKLSPPQAPAPDVSRAEAFGRGAAQGATLGFGDEINGAVQALGQKVLPESLGGSSSKKTLGELYRESRDASRRENKDAQAARPGWYLGGNLVGGLAPSVVAGGTWAAAPAYGAAEKLAKAGRLLGTGAALGAASGLGTSQDPTLLGEAKDAAVGAGLGALSVPAGELVGKAGGWALRKAGDVLRSKALENARRVIVGKQNSLSSQQPLSKDAVQEALDIGAVRPFNTTQNVADKLGVALDEAGGRYADIVATLEQQGIKGPEAQALARQLTAASPQLGRDTLNRGVPAVYRQAANDISAAGSGNVSLSQGEALKRSMQRKSNYDARRPGADMDVNNARKDVASILRQANEDAIDQGVAAKLSEHVPPLRAAVRAPNGQTFVGASHYDAVQKMPQDMINSIGNAAESSAFKDGFVTPAGRFLTREEALAFLQPGYSKAQAARFGTTSRGRLHVDSPELYAASTPYALTPEGQQLATAANQFVPVKQQYGRLAEAERWASQGANRMANSAGPSLIDTVASAPVGAAFGATHGPVAGLIAKQASKEASKQVRTRLPATAAWAENIGADFVDYLMRQNADAARFGVGTTLANQKARALLEALQAQQEKPK